MARPPEIVTDFSWRRGPATLWSAQLQDKVWRGRVAGNTEESSSQRRETGRWPRTGPREEGVESHGRLEKEVTLGLPGSPFLWGSRVRTAGNCHRFSLRVNRRSRGRQRGHEILASVQLVMTTVPRKLQSARSPACRRGAL